MPDVPESATSTRDAIMAATYRALCEHGYAGTSISRIADEFDKSKSLLYYHYEDKDELLADFLGYLLDRLEADLREDLPEKPRERLFGLIEKLAPASVDDEHLQFFRALLEMRAQVPHQSAYREQFERTDELIRAELTDTIKAGIENGDFAPVDPARTAEFVLATLYGVLERGVPTGDSESIQTAREELEAYLEVRLLEEE